SPGSARRTPWSSSTSGGPSAISSTPRGWRTTPARASWPSPTPGPARTRTSPTSCWWCPARGSPSSSRSRRRPRSPTASSTGSPRWIPHAPRSGCARRGSTGRRSRPTTSDQAPSDRLRRIGHCDTTGAILPFRARQGRFAMSRTLMVPVLAGAAIITAIAQPIGTRHLQLGPGQVILFPIIWAIVIGGLVSFQRVRAIPETAQRTALDLVSVGIMVFLVLVGITVGASLDSLKNVTWVLALQEVVHLFGTVIIALPVAVAIRMGRASIGATYSIDREANLAYTAERYGPASPEYRGTVGVYVFGSVFGALYLALLAGYFSSAGWLDPLAL